MHSPLAHPAVPFASGQAAPQAPQCAGSSARSTSHPLAASPSQSAVPSRHTSGPVADDEPPPPSAGPAPPAVVVASAPPEPAVADAEGAPPVPAPPAGSAP